MDFFKILKGGVGVGMNNFDRLFAEKYGGGAWQLTTLTGTLPLSFKSKGEALTDYRIYGTSDGAGVETESGEPTGYKLPLTITSGAQLQNAPIYIGDTKLGAEEYVDYEEQKIYKKTENYFPYGNVGEFKFGAKAKIISDGKGNYIMNGKVTADLASSIIPLDRAFEFPENGFFYLGNPVSARNMRIMFYDENYNYLGFYSIDGAWRIISDLPTIPPIFAIGFGTNSVADYSLNDYTTSPMFSKTGDLTQYVPYFNPTDPPVALPELSTYQGENTLSCSEELGKVSITGYIKGV